MLNKRRKIFGGVFMVVFLLLIITAGSIGAIVSSRQVPYSFTSDQLSSEYLLNKENYSDYQLVEGLVPENPIVDGDLAQVILAPSEVASELQDPQKATLLVVGKDLALFENLFQLWGQQAEQYCNGARYQAGEVGEKQFLLSNCGEPGQQGGLIEFGYYLYSNGDSWIAVKSPEQIEGLDKIISAYKS